LNSSEEIYIEDEETGSTKEHMATRGYYRLTQTITRQCMPNPVRDDELIT
jgi:hypothetical protein